MNEQDALDKLFEVKQEDFERAADGEFKERFITELGKVTVCKGNAVRYHVTYAIRYDEATHSVFAMQVYPPLRKRTDSKQNRTYLYAGCSAITAQRIFAALSHFIEVVL